MNCTSINATTNEALKPYRKVAFYTFGCKLNFSETSTLARQYKEAGFEIVDYKSQIANVYIVNTCSVTEQADKKCLHLVKEIKKKSSKAIICITGCFAQLKPDNIAKMPDVNIVIGAKEKFNTIKIISDFIQKKENLENQSAEELKELKTQIYTSSIDDLEQFIPSHSIDDRTRTFLKVQDGCDYNCSFCTIPLARGKSRSESVQSVVQRINKLKDQKIKEIVLTGINLGDYGIIDGKREFIFLDLLKELDKIDHINRFRISSLEPNLLTDELIEFVSSSQRIMPHFHIPLQSGSPQILKWMRRRYTKEQYLNGVLKIKNLLPHASIGVDVIVGFPGENEAYFQETYDFLHTLPVSYFHVFPYSERANTLAITLENSVPLFERQERAKKLRILSEKKKHEFYTQNIGNKRPILFEQKKDNEKMLGFTDNYIRVAHNYKNDWVNTIQNLNLKEIDEQGRLQV